MRCCWKFQSGYRMRRSGVHQAVILNPERKPQRTQRAQRLKGLQKCMGSPAL